MGKNKKFRITENDFLLANRKASREEEIARHGKQITFRTITQKSKKVYDRKRLKKAGIGKDDLPFLSLDYLIAAVLSPFSLSKLNKFLFRWEIHNN